MFKNKEKVKAQIANMTEDELFLYKLAKKKKRNKIIKVSVCTFLVFLFVFIIFNVVFGSAVGTKFNYKDVYTTAPAKSGEKVDENAGMTLFADNGVLRMEYSPVDDLFIFTDIASGEQFRSWPEPLESEAVYEGTVNNETVIYEYPRYKTNHNIISSPIFVGYTLSGLEGGFVLGVNQFEGAKKTVYKIENGVQLYYELPSIKCSFYIEFALSSNTNSI